MKRYSVQLKQVCKAFEVPYRSGNYVLQQGFVPAGVDASPNSGTPRQFNAAQVYWLGMLLVLKQEGFKTPRAAQIADYAWGSLRTITQNLGWDPRFLPHLGRLQTKYQYLVEVAGSKYLRFGTSAEPLGGGKIRFFDWHRIQKPGKPVPDLRPFVVVRLDLTRIAECVRSLQLAELSY